jgi:hypothetical protein
LGQFVLYGRQQKHGYANQFNILFHADGSKDMRLSRLLIALLFLSGLCAAQVVVAPTTSECATSVDGTVVGIANPVQLPFVAAVFSGSLPAGNYYVEITWSSGGSTNTLPSPEAVIQLGSTGEITVNPPTNVPAAATSMNVYIGSASGGETFQGNVVLPGAWTQSVALTTGASVPTTNNTLCQIIANDAGWPTGTAYIVGLTTPAGDTYPGYPMQWQLLGPGNVINLSQGLPLYNGVVQYPSPILASPYGHAPQSIAGNLSLGGFTLAAGVVNASVGGYQYHGAAPLNHVLVGNGSDYVDSATVPGSAVFYQTIDSAGTAEPQESALNLIPGPGATIACTDNPGSHRTDCTWGAGTNSPLIASITPGTGSGGATITCSICYDNGGIISFTTGGSPSTNAIIFTVTFSGTYTHSACTFSPTDGFAAAYAGATITSGSTVFVLTSGSSALTGTTLYQWSYVCSH